jgi:hypothetical protein
MNSKWSNGSLSKSQEMSILGGKGSKGQFE